MKLMKTGAVSAALLMGALAGAPKAEANFLSGLTGLFKKKPVSGPLTVTAGAQEELGDLLDSFWPRMKGQLETAITSGFSGLSGQKKGKLEIQSFALKKLDISRAPRVTVTPIDEGQKKFLGIVYGKPRYAGETLALQLPGDEKGWTIEVAGKIAYDLDAKLFKTKIKSDLDVTVSKLRVVEELDLDTVTDPGMPAIKQVRKPKLDFDLKIRTHKLLADALLIVLKPIIHEVLEHQLAKAMGQLDPLLASFTGLPGQPFGLGGPALAPFGQQPDLEKAALDISEDIQKDHTPFGTVYEATFTDPTYRQGTVTGWHGMGDSPIWTGSYLTGEALRYAATKDPACVKNAQKVIDGLRLVLDVQQPGGGRLSRYAVPLSHPFAQTLLPLSGDQWIATVNGQQYVCDEHISRDQHVGMMMGLAAAYDWIDDPKVKADCKELIGRVVSFLESTGWNALKRDGSVSAPFVQSPTMIIAFTAAAERTDPARFSAIRKKRSRVASFEWIGTWTSTLDPLEQYYKWNLGHEAYFTALRLETDPDRMKHLEHSFTIMRRTVGHHRQAWFDAVEAALDPAARARISPTVTDDLRRLVARGRRDRPVTNSTDPTIQQAQYAGIQLGNNGAPIVFNGTTLPLSKPPRTVAKYPVPVEKRPSSDFIWQRSPFDLDGGGDPHDQAPGVDVMLPYWAGRYFGFVK